VPCTPRAQTQGPIVVGLKVIAGQRQIQKEDGI
jgi:hypothetical protein